MNGMTGQARIFTLILALLLTAALLIAVFLTRRQAQNAQTASPLVPIAGQMGTDTLESGSRWTGFLTVTEHRGEGVLENGTRAIRGLIGKTDAGTYFELFNRQDPDSAEPILSLWVELDGAEMRPIIGEADAWYFDILLDDRDMEPFTLHLEEDGLSQHYFYDSGAETCWIDFHIKAEKKS